MSALREQLRQHKGWNKMPQRREHAQSPHRETEDLWVRYNALENLHEDYQAYSGAHDSVWLPDADKLPIAKAICYTLMGLVQAVRLGGVLVTRIPPKKQVYPHADTGWHPKYYNCKLYLPVDSNEFCINYAGAQDAEEVVNMRTGEVWFMDNTVRHRVVNSGNEARTTLIVCMRVEP